MTQPSTIGHAKPRWPRAAARILSAGILRKSAIESAPAARASASPPRSASASGRMFSPGDPAVRWWPKEPPLSEIAPWNKPFASGEAQSMLIAMPPADSPKIVTLLGLPPKAAMFFWIHCKAAIMSSRP